ncbi:MAG: hypothetical protein K2X93_05345 [Candidatus Obscuribacterales bacterium]|nr:hypothetical protein [Candidatus Obscuribacterales bacterium]
MTESRLKKIVGVICILALASMLYFMAQEAMSVGQSGYSPGGFEHRPGGFEQRPAIDWFNPILW